MKAKFKAGDKVRLLINTLQKQFRNKECIVKKCYQLTNDELDGMYVYRLECDGETLKGVVPEVDIETIS